MICWDAKGRWNRSLKRWMECRSMNSDFFDMSSLIKGVYEYMILRIIIRTYGNYLRT